MSYHSKTVQHVAKLLARRASRITNQKVHYATALGLAEVYMLTGDEIPLGVYVNEVVKAVKK